MNKFTILFIFICLHYFSNAEISFVETESAIHIYEDLSKKSLVSLSKYNFLEAHKATQTVEDKLGSFNVGEKSIQKSYSLVNEFNISSSEDEVLVTGFLQHKDEKIEYACHFFAREYFWDFSITLSDKTINNIVFNILSDKEEQIFGLGEQFSHCNFKGKVVPMIVEENGIGRGDKTTTGIAKKFGAAGNEMTTYAPIPFFHTTQNRGLLLADYNRCDFDFSSDYSIEIDFWGNSINGYLFQADSPKELLTTYSTINGRMPELPTWIYGSVLGLQGGKEKVNSIIKETLSYGNPVSAIWIQDWVGKRKTIIGSRLQWDWIANETVYPDFKNWVDSLHNEGIKVLGYINPYLVEGGKLCSEALANSYIVHDAEGAPYKFAAGGFNAYMIDFTNPAANDWYKKIIKENMLATGLSGWMADFGEWLPFDATLHSAIDAAVYHNRYPVDWIKLNREAVDEYGKKDIFIFNRSGYSSSSEYATTFWVGDQLANYGENDGLPSAICALNSSGMSGITINHSDIGGYTAISLLMFKFLRDKDILFRWMEMEAFTPIFRTHEGLKPDDMSQFYSDESTQVFFAEMATINKSLQALFEKFGREATETGIPIIRHPYLEFPNDPITYTLKHQFMLGNELMVIPVIEEKSATVTGYLPKGKWEHFFTNEIFEGGEFYTFKAPYGEPAVFRQLGN